MKINKEYSESIGGSEEDFVRFVKQQTKGYVKKSNIEDIDPLIQRIAQNLFYFEDNLSTAKSDYITLIALLMKRGVVFEK